MPSANASQVAPALFAEWAPILKQRIEQVQPRVAAFQGVTAYRAFERYALGVPKSVAGLGPQATTIGRTRLFVVPNPSPANAHVRPADQSPGTTASPTSSTPRRPAAPPYNLQRWDSILVRAPILFVDRGHRGD